MIQLLVSITTSAKALLATSSRKLLEVIVPSISAVTSVTRKVLDVSLIRTKASVILTSKKSATVTAYSKIKATVITGPFIIVKERIVDIANVIDTLYASIFKNTENTAGISDASNNLVDKGIVDNANIDDVFSRTVDYNPTLSDGINTTDDINGAAVDDDQTATYFKNTGDISNVVDVVDSILDKSTPDTYNVSEVVDSLVTKNTADTLNILDPIDTLVDKNTADTSSVSDVSVNLVDKGTEDTSSVSDLVDSLVVKGTSDTSNIGDLFDRTVNYNPTLSDGVNTTDDINGAAVDDDQTATYFKNTGDISNVSDTPANVLDKNTSDTSSVLESAANVFGKNTSDTSNISDASNNLVVKGTADSSNIGDLFDRTVNYNPVLSDGVNTTDDINGAAVDDDQTAVYFKNSSDISNVSDTPANALDKNTTDTSNVLESAANVFGKNTADTSNVSDPIANAVDKSTLDTSNIGDAFSRTVSYNPTLSDSVNTTDDINGAAVDDDQTAQYFKNTSDISNVSDTPANAVDKNTLDTSNISATGVILNQGYVEVGYFLEDYVGDSRNIT